MPTPVYYTALGFRTTQSVLWMTCTLLFAHLNLLLLRVVRDGIQPGVIAGMVWLVVLLLATTRTLRRLEALERQDEEPSAAMRLAFHGALLLPIVGTVPLLFPLFGSL